MFTLLGSKIYVDDNLLPFSRRTNGLGSSQSNCLHCQSKVRDGYFIPSAKGFEDKFSCVGVILKWVESEKLGK